MPSKKYEISIDEDGEFDVAFVQYAKSNHRGAARLTKRFEAFEGNPNRWGEFFRASPGVCMFVIPSREQLDNDGEAGLFALVNEANATITPVRFITPSSKHRWTDYERWAETFLGI